MKTLTLICICIFFVSCASTSTLTYNQQSQEVTSPDLPELLTEDLIYTIGIADILFKAGSYLPYAGVGFQAGGAVYKLFIEPTLERTLEQDGKQVR